MLQRLFSITLCSLVFASVIICAPTQVLAEAKNLGNAGELLDQSAVGTGIENTTLPNAIATALRFILSLLGTLMFGYMVYAGFLWMTAEGESEKIESAKGMMINTVIGFLVVVSAWAITYLVQSRFQ